MRGGSGVEWFLDTVEMVTAAAVVVLYATFLAVLLIGP